MRISISFYSIYLQVIPFSSNRHYPVIGKILQNLTDDPPVMISEAAHTIQPAIASSYFQ